MADEPTGPAATEDIEPQAAEPVRPTAADVAVELSALKARALAADNLAHLKAAVVGLLELIERLTAH